MGTEQSATLDDVIGAIVAVERQPARMRTAAEQLSMESQPRFRKALKFLRHGSTADTLVMTVNNENWLLPSPNRDVYRKTLQTAVKAKTLPIIGISDLESLLG